MRAADLHRLRGKADADWKAEVNREVERILAIPDPGARMRAYAELARALGEDGDALPPGAEERIASSLRGGVEAHGREQAMDAWAVDRRRMALVVTLRPVAAAGCVLAALAPFAVAAVRWGWGVGDALAAFLAPGPALAGVALAAVAAGVMARMLGCAGTLEGLAWSVVGSGVAGVLGLALATH